MEHKEIIRKLGAFLDNELSDEVKNTVKAHINGCPQCSKEVEELIARQLYIRNAPAIEVDASFRAKITEKIEAQRAAKPAGFGRFIPIPLALSALILIFSAYMIVAPVAYGMNISSVKSQTGEMAANAMLAGACGSIFAPLSFAKFCGACTQNACTCCQAKCSTDCRMKMKTGGCKDGN